MRPNLQRILSWRKHIHRTRWLLVSAGVLAVLLLVQGGRYLWLGMLERKISADLAEANAAPPEREGVKELKAYAKFEELCRGAPKPSKPKEKLWGIMGGHALFGGSAAAAKLHKVGDTISTGEKIVAIKINGIVLEKDGTQRTEVVFEELKMSAKPKPPGNKSQAKAPKSSNGNTNTGGK